MLTEEQMIGARFGRLVVASIDGATMASSALCRCDCGRETTTIIRRLVIGKTRSCGCLRRESMAGVGRANARHGMTASRTHASWSHMLARCAAHPSYTSRGIKVCDRWLSFENFLSDMGERPPGTSLDRVDNERGYEPGNCRWATPKQQQNNTRRNIRVTHNGETKTVRQWADALGVPYQRLLLRLRRGWDFSRAVEEASCR